MIKLSTFDNIISISKPYQQLIKSLIHQKYWTVLSMIFLKINSSKHLKTIGKLLSCPFCWGESESGCAAAALPVLSENFSFIQILGDISQNIMHVGDSNHSHTFTILLVLVMHSIWCWPVLRRLVVLWILVIQRVLVLLMVLLNFKGFVSFDGV